MRERGKEKERKKGEKKGCLVFSFIALSGPPMVESAKVEGGKRK